jgi:hypothetical protein
VSRGGVCLCWHDGWDHVDDHKNCNHYDETTERRDCDCPAFLEVLVRDRERIAEAVDALTQHVIAPDGSTRIRAMHALASVLFR